MERFRGVARRGRFGGFGAGRRRGEVAAAGLATAPARAVIACGATPGRADSRLG